MGEPADTDAGDGALINALLDALGVPAAVVSLPDFGVVQASEDFPFEFWGEAQSGSGLLQLAELFRRGQPPPQGIEWRPVSAKRLLVIHRRLEGEEALLDLQKAENDEELGAALARLALAEGARAARVLLVDGEDSRVLASAGRIPRTRLRPPPQRKRDKATLDLFSADHLSSDLLTPRSPAEVPGPATQEEEPALTTRVWTGKPELHLQLWGAPNDTIHALETCSERVLATSLAFVSRHRLLRRLELGIEELSERNTTLRTVLNALPEPLWLVDSRGVVELANDAAVQLFEGHLSNLKQLSQRTEDERSRRQLDELAQKSSAQAWLKCASGTRLIDFKMKELDQDRKSRVILARDMSFESYQLRGMQAMVHVSQLSQKNLPPQQLADEIAEYIRQHFHLDEVAIFISEDGSGPGDAKKPATSMRLLGTTGELSEQYSESPAVKALQNSALPCIETENNKLHVAAAFELQSGARGVLFGTKRHELPPPIEVLLPFRYSALVLTGAIAQALEASYRQLAQSQAQKVISAALAALPEAVFITDSQGRIQITNKIGKKLIDFSLKNGAQQSWTPAPQAPLVSQASASEAKTPPGEEQEESVGLFQAKAHTHYPLADELFTQLHARHTDGTPLLNPVQSALRGLPSSREIYLDYVAPDSGESSSQAVLSSIPLSLCDDKPSGAVVVLRDVSRQRELERMKDTFLAMAAHELRTPLASMKAFTQHSLRQMAAGTSSGERIERSLTLIERQIDRLHALVNDLLEVTQFLKGGLVLNPQPADLSQLVRDVCEQLGELSDKHQLIVSAPRRLWATVDPLRIEQVLANLISNAFRYSPEGGCVEVKLSHNKGGVLLEVVDQGIGIAPERLNLIFERFYRAHDDPLLSPGGLGLGLWIVREIVLRHKGNIHIESELGLGSTVQVALPLGDE